MLGKAKRLKREGATMPFSEVKIDGISNIVDSNSVLCDIEVTDNKVIRFRKVDLLIEYLKRSHRCCHLARREFLFVNNLLI
ncbi:MAG: hypothetical protein HOP07_12385 [Bacteriovoracaceae bacterium]|nr:hypothetical protein [Bacteriovoracaceae bacterium]